MTKIVAVTASTAGEAHTQMAAEALKRTAQAMGHEIVTEAQSGAVVTALSPNDIQQADVVIVGTDGAVERDRFAGKPIYAVSTSEAIRNTEMVVQSAVALVGQIPSLGAIRTTPHPHDPLPGELPTVEREVETGAVATPIAAPASKFFVGITSCPTGIAHTFMAAEALKQGALKLGHDIKVETQGSVGSQNALTDDEIARAEAVIIAADTHVDLSRFGGKRLYETSTKAAIHNGANVVTAAMDAPVAGGGSGGSGSYVDEVNRAKAERSESRSGPYKHLLTGVSYMLPVIVAGGLIIALSFVFGIDPAEGTFGDALMQIGGGAAFSLIVPVLSGFIAFSIADRPGIAPGLIGGMLAANLGMGFLGGILSGFLAGYVAKFVRDKVNLPANFEGLKPVLVIPLLATLVVGLLLVYVFGGPVRFIMEGMTTYLQGLTGTNALLLGLILGAMMAVDMGGPVNKAAYTFAVGLLASNLYAPMAAVMAAGMTPPLGLALATFVSKKHFNQAEQEAGKVASVLGISFITEGAIPFAANDPLRILPACVAGSAVTGALSMVFGCTLRAPHGGIFVLAIPNAVEHVGLYIVAIAAGTLVTALATVQLKHFFPRKKVAVVEA
ncbi:MULTISPECIES: PTS fructose-like transporter subunit IIB [Cyanophyceae]|uniref:PTS fructose-like transporter subunit IIB n=1 Tax=Leptolyngbya subtilissima DQ-A4 TaxID=2933933 RepID=A0ABV0KBM4_9CYAN|nr:PTS fructose-like transporter subunit IIB [Nodosilinea sp. FACHB-141]MBD2113689.1 PTS fructose-like transporter subunit IIB [Nodosilinea sp. FACHB-141]